MATIMRGDRKPVPEHMRHRIEPTATGFDLQTCYGYVLKSFASKDDACAYYDLHCPEI